MKQELLVALLVAGFALALIASRLYYEFKLRKHCTKRLPEKLGKLASSGVEVCVVPSGILRKIVGDLYGLTIGFAKPVVFISSSVFKELSESATECIVAHELAHARLRHNTKSILGVIASTSILITAALAGNIYALGASALASWLLAHYVNERLELEADKHAALEVGPLKYFVALVELRELEAKISRNSSRKTRVSSLLHAFMGYPSYTKRLRNIENLVRELATKHSNAHVNMKA